MTEFQSTLWTLIRGADRGDEAALREFVFKYRAPVVSYIAARGLAGEAEDLAQEVFLRVFQDRVLAKADPARGRFRGLLLSVTRHVIGHHLERRSAQKRGPIQSLEGLDVASQEPEENFDRQWVSHLLEVALARLSRDHAHYHEALKRFLMDGETCAEIAKSLDKTEGDVHNYLRRGKAKLAEYLREQIREYSASRAEFEDELRFLSKYFPPGS